MDGRVGKGGWSGGVVKTGPSRWIRRDEHARQVRVRLSRTGTGTRDADYNTRFAQGHARHGGAGRRAASVGRQRQQLEPALDRAVRPADQPMDDVDADADAPEFGGRRAALLFQHGR